MEKVDPPIVDEKQSPPPSTEVTVIEAPINASGHIQELERNFGIVSLCSLAITSGNAWIALGGTLTVAIYNGGPPGAIYEFIVVSIFYAFVAASIAELSSAIPSSGGVYHWASVTAGPYGRSLGYFAGWWNCLAWLLGIVSTLQIVAAQSVSMYAVMHPSFTTQRWHVFVSYLIIAWISCFIVLYLNRALPTIESIGGSTVVAGVLITIIVCAVMPYVNSQPYASSSTIWSTWDNETGYSSDGLVFVLGMLNGAFAIGCPDVVTHLAEEVPKPGRIIPKTIFAQFVFGFLSGFFYLITILYGINDFQAVLNSTYLFPLTEIYRQAAGSNAGAVGLLFCAFVPFLISTVGCYLTASRIFWTLARDNATPFSRFFAHVSHSHHNPGRSIIFCALFCTVLGCIYVGSSTAFSAFVGAFVVLSTLSYLAAILPHLLSKRRNVRRRGWFWMPSPWGELANTVACAYMLVFLVIFCFPFALPVDAKSMNYTSLIAGGLTLAVAAFWGWRQKEYKGPTNVVLDEAVTAKDAL